MDPLQAALIGLVLMCVFMALGMPIAFSMLLTGALGNVYLLSPQAAAQLLSGNVWDQFSSYGLSVVPLFVLMGQFAYRAGITERLYEAAYKWVGQYPGGLAGTTIAACAGFSAICGSNSATTATMGTIALPEMRRYRYDAALSTGAVAVGGTLGVVIPPSVVMIVIAVQTEQSLLKLFLAGIVPGLILTALFLLTIVVMCARNPALGPLGPMTTLQQKLRSLSGVIEALLLFALVMGGLYLGWFTPTEAGAAGAFGALVIGVARRRLSWKGFVLSIVESVRISAMVVLLITGAVLFGRFLTVSQLPFELADWAAALPVAPAVVLLVVIGIYLIGGALMDALGFLVVTIPIFFPLAAALGYDPVWFTMVLTIVTTMGAITPPVGVNVFIVQGLVPDIPLHTIFRGVTYFFLAYALCIAVMWLWPATVLALPRALLG
ncbi:MAG: TRAP transporter large permease [Burkholderiaceae bacterium]|nr:MAG: TRAP transporter large permease [Burkholderiaceae bacterium]MBE7427819.1 TRAP transporter large permease [Ideonella sp.]MCC7285629.1 TRAP transporter large permease [Burkholderiaceae bacterium]